MTLPITDLPSVISFIPQRPPMVMVDALLSYTATTGAAGLTIAADNLFVQNGHLQEAGVVEHIAQSIALHKGYYYYLQHQSAPMGYIGSIKRMSIYALPEVGVTLTTELSIIQEFMGVTLVKVRTTAGGVLIAEGEMKTVIAESIDN
mgnify:FL=1